MPSSDASPPTGDLTHCLSTDQSRQNPDYNVDEDEEEYEEVEVEEEVEEIEEEIEEVEEEIEEVEEEVEEEEEDTEGDSPNDSQVMESEGHGEHDRSLYPRKPVQSLAQDAARVEDVGASSTIPSHIETVQKEELITFASAGRISENPSSAEYENKVSSTVGNAEATIPCCQEVAPRFGRDVCGGKDNGGMHVEKETKQTAVRSAEDIKQMPPRSPLPQIRLRSVSPGAEFDDGNKRLAVACDFFAKGWCIKGKSCRFLHVREDVGTSINLQKGVEAASDKKSELSAVEGLRENFAKSELLCHSEVAASSSAKMPTCDGGQRQRCELSPRAFSCFRDAGSGSSRDNWSADSNGKYASSFMRGNSPLSSTVSFHGTLSGSFDRLSHTYQSSGFPSYGYSLEGVASKSDQFMLAHRTLPSSSTSLTAGILPSTSTSSKSALSFSPRSKNVASFDADSGRSLSNIIGHTFPFSGYKTKIFSDDWEPSIPFRPSFFINGSLPSAGGQYDPFLDSIELPNSGDKCTKCSSANPVSVGNSGSTPRYSSDKHSITACDTFHKNSSGKNLLRENLSTLGTRQLDPSVSKRRDKIMLGEEEKSLTAACVRDVSKSNRETVNNDSGCQIDHAKNMTDFIRARESNEMDVDLGTDGDMHKESKALKYFRAALVDFVKDLVKPTWRDGHLSKDAHKMVVKKTVDKVLGTMTSIPSTAELIKQFLSSSQSKISKLVEAYIDKYGKI